MEIAKTDTFINKSFKTFKNCLLLFSLLQIALILAFLFTYNVFCHTCYLRLSTREAFSSVVQYQDIISVDNKKNPDWCRLQKWRVNWKDMAASCEGKMAWGKREVNSLYRTDADLSYIKKWDLQDTGNLVELILNPQ